MKASKKFFITIFVVSGCNTIFGLKAQAQPRSKQIHASKLETEDSLKPSEGLFKRNFENLHVATDVDTCTMALLHHARIINREIEHVQFYLRGLIGQTPKMAIVEWPVEKPNLNRTGARNKIQEALKQLELSKKDVSELAGRNGSNFANSTIIAKNRCENGLELGKMDKSFSAALQSTQSLFDNGYIEFKHTNFEGFSETFLSPLYKSQHQLDKLAKALIKKPERRFLGLLGSQSPHEKSRTKIIALEKSLRAKYPLAFDPNASKNSPETKKQMLETNREISSFIKKTPIGYTDAAILWRTGLVRDINSNSDPLASAFLVDDEIIDTITE